MSRLVSKGLKRAFSTKIQLKNEKRTTKEDPKILKHFANCRHILDVPPKYFKRAGTCVNSLILIDYNVADVIGSSILREMQKGNHRLILESNPGIGLLTKKFVGKYDLRIYESEPHFRNILNNMKIVMNSDMKIYDHSLLDLSKLSALNKYSEEDRMKDLFTDMCPKSWLDDIAFSIVAPVPSRIFIQHILNSFFSQRGIVSFGRPELYLILSPTLYKCLMAKPDTYEFHYQRLSVLYQIVFETELLSHDIPRKVFLPWMKPANRKHRRCKEEFEEDNKSLYLIKSTGRKSVIEGLGKQETLLEPLVKFIRQCMACKRKYVIPTLEMVIPNCGPRLVMEGLTIFTQFKELGPEALFNLFLSLMKWPEFEQTLLKALENEDSGVKASAKPDKDDDEVDDHEDEVQIKIKE